MDAHMECKGAGTASRWTSVLGRGDDSAVARARCRPDGEGVRGCRLSVVVADPRSTDVLPQPFWFDDDG